MPATSSVARRVAAALLGATVLLSCAAGVPAYAGPADGTIKVTPPGTANDATPQSDTTPIVDGCTFDVEFYDFDNFIAGIEVVTVQLYTQDQDGPGRGTPIGLPVIATLRQTPGGSFNGEQELSVNPTGLPRAAQGIPLRVEVDRLSGAEGKSKIFWLNCKAAPATSSPALPTSPSKNSAGPGPATTAAAPATATTPARPTGTATARPTASATPADTPSATPAGTPSGTPAATPGGTPSATPSATPEAAPSPSAATESPVPLAEPVKVNAGGESNGSGLVFLAIAGAGIAAAAGYGLVRGRKRA